MMVYILFMPESTEGMAEDATTAMRQEKAGGEQQMKKAVMLINDISEQNLDL